MVLSAVFAVVLIYCIFEIESWRIASVCFWFFYVAGTFGISWLSGNKTLASLKGEFIFAGCLLSAILVVFGLGLVIPNYPFVRK